MTPGIDSAPRRDKTGPDDALRRQFMEYQAKAGQGDAAAQYNLGFAYSKGEGVEKNNTEAYAWFNLASLTKKNAAMPRDVLEKTLSPQ